MYANVGDLIKRVMMRAQRPVYLLYTDTLIMVILRGRCEEILLLKINLHVPLTSTFVVNERVT